MQPAFEVDFMLIFTLCMQEVIGVPWMKHCLLFSTEGVDEKFLVERRLGPWSFMALCCREIPYGVGFASQQTDGIGLFVVISRATWFSWMFDIFPSECPLEC